MTCDDCRNGGTCRPSLDGCDCPEGWTGLLCNESEAGRGGGGAGAGPSPLLVCEERRGVAWGVARLEERGAGLVCEELGEAGRGPEPEDSKAGAPPGPAVRCVPAFLLGIGRPWGLAGPSVRPSPIPQLTRVW